MEETLFAPGDGLYLLNLPSFCIPWAFAHLPTYQFLKALQSPVDKSHSTPICKRSVFHEQKETLPEKKTPKASCFKIIYVQSICNWWINQLAALILPRAYGGGCQNPSAQLLDCHGVHQGHWHKWSEVPFAQQWHPDALLEQVGWWQSSSVRIAVDG